MGEFNRSSIGLSGPMSNCAGFSTLREFCAKMSILWAQQVEPGSRVEQAMDVAQRTLEVHIPGCPRCRVGIN